ncbi:MAG: hypothetical protein AAF958_12300 [Planctomycetota bacterium]
MNVFCCDGAHQQEKYRFKCLTQSPRETVSFVRTRLLLGSRQWGVGMGEFGAVLTIVRNYRTATSANFAESAQIAISAARPHKSKVSPADKPQIAGNANLTCPPPKSAPAGYHRA